MAKKRKTGPKLDHLKINDDWESAVNKALMKRKPTGGWPKKAKK
jgi:hypothetical protein